MISLKPCSDKIDLAPLRKKVLASSNFNFAWQFYETDGANLRDAANLSCLLNHVTEQPELHQFLRSSFSEDEYGIGYHFEIHPLHEHTAVAELAGTEFEVKLAAIAEGVCGAFASERDASLEESRAIEDLFSQISSGYHVFRYEPWFRETCKTCAKYHWFSNWFHNVIWDWCFLVTWPEQNLLWIGCLTDTD